MENIFMARKMENFRPNQKQRFTGGGRNVSKGQAYGEGVAKVRAGGNDD